MSSCQMFTPTLTRNAMSYRRRRHPYRHRYHRRYQALTTPFRKSFYPVPLKRSVSTFSRPRPLVNQSSSATSLRELSQACAILRSAMAKNNVPEYKSVVEDYVSNLKPLSMEMKQRKSLLPETSPTTSTTVRSASLSSVTKCRQ